MEECTGLISPQPTVTAFGRNQGYLEQSGPVRTSSTSFCPNPLLTKRQSFNFFDPKFMEGLHLVPGQLLELAGNEAYLQLLSSNDTLKIRNAQLEGELKGSQNTAQ